MASFFDGMQPDMPGVLGARPRNEGIGSKLLSIFAGQNNPNMSPEQNAAARKQALLHAGLATILANSQNPNALAALAFGALQGQQTRASVNDNFAQQQMQNAIGSLMGGQMTPERVQALMRLGVQTGNMELFKQALDLYKQMTQVHNVGPGGALATSTGQKVFEQEKQIDLPPDLEAFIWESGGNPNNIAPEQRAKLLARWQDAQQAKAAAGASRVTVNTGNETMKGVVDIALKDYGKIMDAAGTAQSRLTNLATMSALLEDGMPTGRVDALTMPMRELAASFGVGNAEKLSQQQVFRALHNKLALESKAGMTGTMTDRDIQFLKEMVPGIKNTPEGNRLLIEILQRQAQRQIELANLANQYIGQNGVLDHRWFQFKQQWLSDPSNALFSDLEPRRVGNAPGGVK